MGQNCNDWRNPTAEQLFDESQDTGSIDQGFGHERIMPQRASFGSTTQQFPSAFHSAGGPMDRPAPRDFATYPDAYQVVLDGRSGQIIVPSTRQNPDSDTMSRFYDNAPWTAQGIDNMSAWGPGTVSGPRFITQNQSVIRPPASYMGYREPAKSNPESHFTGKQQQDSGYDTMGQRTAKSVVSGGNFSDRMEDNQSFVNGVGGMEIQSNKLPPAYYASGSDTERPLPNSYENGSEHGEMSLACPYPDCREETKFRNASDLKKHTQRHEKPHKCDIPGCQRRDGFTTKNDLDRHKKSLHGIVPSNSNDRSFKCAGVNCSKKTKIWPRLDNFKSHCSRMHATEDVEELVKKSEVEPDKGGEVSNLASAVPPLRSQRTQSTDGSHIDATLLLSVSQEAHLSYTPFAPNFHHSPGRNTMEHGNAPVGSDRGGHFESSIIDNGTHPSVLSSSSQRHQSSHVPLSESASPRSTEVSIDRVQTRLSSPNIRSPESNEALAEKLQQSNSLVTTSKSANRSSWTTKLQEFSKTLASESAQSLRSRHSIEDLRRIIENRVTEFMNALKHGKRSSEDAALDDPAPRAKRVSCRICFKTMDRPCDLKKHEKRHSRPWGCTDANCTKTFGSKNDWKRHENSQHYQLETWRCHEPSATSKINQCAMIFSRRDPFQAHLRKDHGISDEGDIRDQCRKRRIGRNWQNGFWCGFCKDIIKLQTRGLEAWDERFNHIDDLHFKQGKNIEDWYPMDKDIPKGKLRLEDLQDDKTSNTLDIDSESDDNELDDLSMAVPPPGGSTRDCDLGNTAHAVRLNPPTPEPEDANTWYCRNCGHGPMSKAMYMHCFDCQKRRV